jgi:predicted  nucleic acid-binding Zn-ribbon protein
MSDKELIWVSKEVKAIYENLDSDQEKLRIIEETIKSRKEDITYTIESLDDDLLRFKAFALKYKTELQKVYEEQNNQLEKLFEDIGGMQDNIYLKIEQAKKQLNPITDKVKEINKTLDNVNTYKIERLIELIEKFNRMSEENKMLFELLIRHTDISR